MQWGFDADIADIHVQHVGFDSPPHDRRRQVDAFGREQLHQRFGNDAAAVVAARGTLVGEVARFVDVHRDIQIDRRGQAQQEMGEERSCRPAADHADARAIGQREARRFATREVSREVVAGPRGALNESQRPLLCLAPEQGNAGGGAWEG